MKYEINDEFNLKIIDLLAIQRGQSKQNYFDLKQNNMGPKYAKKQNKKVEFNRNFIIEQDMTEYVKEKIKENYEMFEKGQIDSELLKRNIKHKLYLPINEKEIDLAISQDRLDFKTLLRNVDNQKLCSQSPVRLGPNKNKIQSYNLPNNTVTNNLFVCLMFQTLQNKLLKINNLHYDQKYSFLIKDIQQSMALKNYRSFNGGDTIQAQQISNKSYYILFLNLQNNHSWLSKILLMDKQIKLISQEILKNLMQTPSKQQQNMFYQEQSIASISKIK